MGSHRSVRLRAAGVAVACALLAMLMPVTGAVAAGTSVTAAPVGIARTPGNNGYWTVTTKGEVSGFGAAVVRGDLPSVGVTVGNVVGMAATPSGQGYWLVASDGGVFAFGDAPFRGSMGGQPLNKPVVGMAATPSGQGYWLVASDGGVFAFGDAPFHGSMGGQPLNAAIVGIDRTPAGEGYWLVGSDGGVFAFGAAGFFSSLGDVKLNERVADMVATGTGRGYWLVAQDGGVFAFGDAVFYGRPTVAGVVVPTGRQRPGNLQVSAAAASFIASYEGFRSQPYNDPVGHCTIGYGHLLHKGNCTQVDRNKWGTWTQEEAKGWLQQDADRLVNGIKPSIAQTPLHQHEFDALASWAYNLGSGGFTGSGLDIQLSKSPPNYGAVPGELLKWVNANGVKLCGLYRRRTNEGKLFSTSSYAIVTVTCPSGYR